MVCARLNIFACLLSLLSANHALARVSNITFLGSPTQCSPVTISWQGGVPPFTVNVLQVDLFAQPGPDGIIPGNIVQAVDTGNARRVVWTAAVVPGEVLVAVVRDGLNQDATSPKRVVQTSANTACLEAVSSDPLTTPNVVVLPSLSVSALGGTSTSRTPTTGTPTIFVSAATESPSETPLITNQNRVTALPILLTLFTIGTVVGISVYGFCLYRSGAPKRLETREYDDIERGHYGIDSPMTSLQILGTYSRELGRGITRKISALSSQISRRPTAVVATEKPESFTILPEDSPPPAVQEMSQASPGGRADVVDPRSIIGAPIMSAHAINASRPTSSVTVSTSSWTTETGTGLSPRPTDKGLRPAPSKSNLRGKGRPLPKPPALHLDRQGTQRQYGLPTASNRLEAIRPKSRSKSAIIVEPNQKRVSSIRRSASAGAPATLGLPPAHLAQVPISALPPATPISSRIRPYSQVSGRPSPKPGATTEGASSRRRPNTIGSALMVQEVPFVIESPTISRFNQSIDTPRTEPRNSLPATRPNMPNPLIIPSSLPRSDEYDHIDSIYDIPQTATTARTRYSMALPESGSLLPVSFGAAQEEAVPPLPFTPKSLRMAARTPSRPTSPTRGGDPLK